MKKTTISLLILVLGISFTAVSAYPFDYQNKELNANLANGKQIHLQFTNEVYPIIDNGYIVGTTGFSLLNTPVRIYPNSFVITMPEEGWFVVGNHIQGNNYAVKLNEWNGATFLKTEFKASLENIKLEQPSIITPSKPTEPTAKPTEKKNLLILVRQSLRNYWNDNYQIFVKVFDKKLNPNPDFDSFSGAVNADITVNLALSDGSGKKTITGKTQNGLWQGKQYFTENLDKSGKYTVSVVAKDGDSSVSQNYEMFLFGVAANRITITNSTAP
jgi:hypothetical protein